MKTQLEIAKATLFDAGGLGATNLKLFPGSSRDVTSEAMAAEINKALDQLTNGQYDVVDQFDD